MAVVDKYTDTLFLAGKAANSAQFNGANIVAFSTLVTIASTDNNGSIYRLAKALPADLIPFQILIANDAQTGTTSVDLGLYRVTTPLANGAVIDKDIFMAAQSMASARAIGGEVNGLGNLIANSGITFTNKRLWELAGDTISNKAEGYDLALTGNTLGGVAGNILVRAIFLQG